MVILCFVLLFPSVHVFFSRYRWPVCCLETRHYVYKVALVGVGRGYGHTCFVLLFPSAFFVLSVWTTNLLLFSVHLLFAAEAS